MPIVVVASPLRSVFPRFIVGDTSTVRLFLRGRLNTISMACSGLRGYHVTGSRPAWAQQTEKNITIGIHYDGDPKACYYTQEQFYDNAKWMEPKDKTSIEFVAPESFRHIATIPVEYQTLNLPCLTAYEIRMVRTYMFNFIYLASRYFMQVEQAQIVDREELSRTSHYHRSKLQDHVNLVTSVFYPYRTGWGRDWSGVDLGPVSPSIFRETLDLADTLANLRTNSTEADERGTIIPTRWSIPAPIDPPKPIAYPGAPVTDGTSRAVQDPETSDKHNDS